MGPSRSDTYSSLLNLQCASRATRSFSSIAYHRAVLYLFAYLARPCDLSSCSLFSSLKPRFGPRCTRQPWLESSSPCWRSPLHWHRRVTTDCYKSWYRGCQKGHSKGCWKPLKVLKVSWMNTEARTPQLLISGADSFL